MDTTSRPHRRRQRQRHRQRGFTLLEIVAAFSILALGLALSMRIATGAMAQASRGATHTEAALNAKSVLDTAGVGERLEEGVTSGEFDERYRWELDVQPWQPDDAGAAPAPAVAPVELYRLQLTVFWQQGGNERSARFATLRALTPVPVR